MRPLDFYRLGLSLAETANDEATQRTAVSRLYYGLHHEACCRYFRSNFDGRPLFAGRRHAELPRRYSNQEDERAREVGRLLRNLLALRRMADYDIASPFTPIDATIASQELLNTALGTARQLLNALDAYSPGEAEEGCRCLVSF